MSAQRPAATERFAGDGTVLSERKEFTNGGGQTKVTATEGPGTLPDEAAQSGVLLLTGHARTHGKGMRGLVPGQV